MVGPTFYQTSQQVTYANYTTLVETFGWTPSECKGMTIRERKYWLAYLEYKKRLESYRKMITPLQPRQ